MEIEEEEEEQQQHYTIFYWDVYCDENQADMIGVKMDIEEGEGDDEHDSWLVWVHLYIQEVYYMIPEMKQYITEDDIAVIASEYNKGWSNEYYIYLSELPDINKLDNKQDIFEILRECLPSQM